MFSFRHPLLQVIQHLDLLLSETDVGLGIGELGLLKVDVFVDLLKGQPVLSVLQGVHDFSGLVNQFLGLFTVGCLFGFGHQLCVRRVHD